MRTEVQAERAAAEADRAEAEAAAAGGEGVDTALDALRSRLAEAEQEVEMLRHANSEAVSEGAASAAALEAARAEVSALRDAEERSRAGGRWRRRCGRCVSRTRPRYAGWSRRSRRSGGGR